MKPTETEVVQPGAMVHQPETSSLMAVIANAAQNPAVDVDKMERLLAMQERVMARQSEEAFNRAMAECQKEMPRIVKDATNPSTSSKFARLETVNRDVIPIYTKHGFSLSFGTADCTIADHYRITCVVSNSGHSRSYQCDLPRDDMGAKDNRNKTKMHGAGSTMSYGRRYLTLMIFNISLLNEDDDGSRGRQQKPQGPSSVAAPDPELEIYRGQLWALLKDVRGPAKNWDEANKWLWREEILDAAADERAPRLSAAKFKEVIEKVKAKLA